MQTCSPALGRSRRQPHRGFWSPTARPPAGGRRGRHWSSAPHASLTFSLAWLIDAADLSGLSLAVGTAIADAIEPGSARLRLKWPNDLWLLDAGGNGRKVGGILIETAPLGDRRVAVIGIGLNVLEQRVDDAASGVGWLREIDAAATPLTILSRVVPALLDALPRFERSGFAAFADRYAARDLLQGRAVRCSGGANTAAIEGTAIGVGPSGELLVQHGGDVERVVSGEISVRLASDAALLPRQAAGSPC